MRGSLPKKHTEARRQAFRRGGSRRGGSRTGAALIAIALLAAAGRTAEVQVLWEGLRGSADAAAWRRFAATAEADPPSSWTFRGADVVWNYEPGISVWSSPAIAEIDGRVACFAGSYDHNIYALDVATGSELWRFPTGNGVFATPAVVRIDGRDTVLVSSSDRTLYWLDARGGMKIGAYTVYEWSQSLGRAFLSAPLVVFGVEGPSVVVVSWVYDTAAQRATETAEILALDPGNRRLMWRRRFAESHPSHPVWAAVGGRPRVYVGCRDGNLYCLDGESGAEIWRRTSKFPVDATPAVLERRGDGPALVLVGSKFGDMRAFEAVSGQPVWSFKAGHWVDATPALVRLPDGRDAAVFGSYDGRVYCLDARTGKGVWRYKTAGNVVSSAAVIPREAGFDVFVPSDDDRLHAVNGETGREIWRISPGRFLWAYRGLGDTIWASPAAVRLGDVDMLVVPFYDGRIHGYRLDRSEQWVADHGDPAYGRSMLARIGLSMIATLALAVAFIRTGASRRNRRA